MLLVRANYAAAARRLGLSILTFRGQPQARATHRPSVIHNTLTTRTPKQHRLRTAAMDAALVDFVNGLPSLSCALVSTYDDLADGKAVVEAAQHVLGCSEADAHASLEALSGVDAGRLERREVEGHHAVTKCDTSDNLADLLTKALDPIPFDKLRRLVLNILVVGAIYVSSAAGATHSRQGCRSAQYPLMIRAVCATSDGGCSRVQV